MRARARESPGGRSLNEPVDRRTIGDEPVIRVGRRRSRTFLRSNNGYSFPVSARTVVVIWRRARPAMRRTVAVTDYKSAAGVAISLLNLNNVLGTSATVGRAHAAKTTTIRVPEKFVHRLHGDYSSHPPPSNRIVRFLVRTTRLAAPS